MQQIRRSNARDAARLQRGVGAFQGGLSSLFHLDLSANAFTDADVYVIGAALDDNRTLCGLHFEQNPGGGFVDARGFLTQDKLGSATAVAAAAPALASARSRCWCCSQWIECKVSLTLVDVPTNAKISAMWLTTNIDGWAPNACNMAPDNRTRDSWSVHRMIPRTGSFLFVIIVDTAGGSKFEARLEGVPSCHDPCCPGDGGRAHVVHTATTTASPSVARLIRRASLDEQRDSSDYESSGGSGSGYPSNEAEEVAAAAPTLALGRTAHRPTTTNPKKTSRSALSAARQMHVRPQSAPACFRNDSEAETVATIVSPSDAFAPPMRSNLESRCLNIKSALPRTGKALAFFDWGHISAHRSVPQSVFANRLRDFVIDLPANRRLELEFVEDAEYLLTRKAKLVDTDDAMEQAFEADWGHISAHLASGQRGSSRSLITNLEALEDAKACVREHYRLFRLICRHFCVQCGVDVFGPCEHTADAKYEFLLLRKIVRWYCLLVVMNSRGLEQLVLKMHFPASSGLERSDVNRIFIAVDTHSAQDEKQDKVVDCVSRGHRYFSWTIWPLCD